MSAKNKRNGYFHDLWKDSKSDKNTKILFGDFNSKLGQSQGSYGKSTLNENGEKLNRALIENKLVVTNTCFK